MAERQNALAGTRAGAYARSTPEGRARDKARGNALAAGVLDFGGLTTEAANSLGYPETSQWLQGSQSEDPTMAAAGSMINPGSLWGVVYGAGKGLYDAVNEPDVQQPKLLTKDEFFSSRRSKRGSLKDAQDAAEDKVRNSKAYLDTLADGRRKTAQGMIDTARANSASGWESDQKTAAAEDANLEADYAAHKSDYDRQMEAYYGRDFADRNPGLSKAFAAGGPLAAALLTRGVFKGVNAKAASRVAEANTARASGKLADEARAIDKVKWWDDNGGKIKLGGAAAAATIPFDMQMFGDVYDKKTISPDYQDSEGNWQRSRAQQKAEEKLSNPVKYVTDNALSFGSGIVGSLVGSKMAGKGPQDEINSVLNPPTADRLNGIVDQRILELEQARRLKQAIADSRSPIRPQPAPGMGQAQPQAGPQPQVTSSPVPALPPPQAPVVTGGTPQGSVQSASEFSPYRGGARSDAQGAWNGMLDAVPTQARSSYTPDVEQTLKMIESQGRNINPAVLRQRAQGSVDQFQTIRGSGGDPFSEPARRSMIGGTEKLAIPLALGVGAADPFERGIQELKQVFLDIDGDGIPDVAVPINALSRPQY
jgi:hypothetical protein